MDQNFLLTTMILAIRNQISRLDGEYLSEYNLTYQQYSVLTIMFAEAKEMSITSLANYIGVRQPTMTGIIKRLEQKDFVKKKMNNADTRRIQIVLTSKAKKILNKMEPKQSHGETKLFESLTTAEKKQLSKLLSKLIQQD